MEKTTETLNSNGMAMLLSLGKEAEEAEDEEDTLGLGGEVLAAFLARKVSLGKQYNFAPCCVLKRECEEAQSCLGRELGELLTGSDTDLSTLRALKDYGKMLVRQSISEPEKAAATAIYYASIAAALSYHQERITSLETSRLSEGLSLLAGKAWIPDHLKTLYQKAGEFCREDTKSGESG